MAKIDETAFAKINLDLRICRRRADGYHDLDSIVVFAGIGDHLSFEPADSLSLTINGPFGSDLPADDGNLVIRAAKAIAEMAGQKANVRISLEKRLPVAAGLGGGSADAAATLRGLTRFWNLSLGLDALFPLARRLGADVPVCLGSKAARMQDIGDRLTSITLPTTLSLILVNPRHALSTAAVFSELQTISGARDQDSLGKTDQHFRTSIMESLNDLEPAALRIAPVISDVLGAIRSEPGCTLARMSGSGATCFGLFDDQTSRDQAAPKLKSRYPSWWVVGTDTR